MEIVKIAHLSTEEVEALKTAGTILGTLVKGLDDGSISELAEQDVALVKALSDVVYRATSKTIRG